MKNTMTKNAPTPRKSRLNSTKNDLPAEARAQLVELLNAHLASGLDLYFQTKQAHWNVKGTNFIALHELFDTIATAVQAGNDEIAERCVQLGGSARGTVQAVAGDTSLTPYPLELQQGSDHVEALSNALADFGRQTREAIEATDKLGDKDSSDLFTGMSREIDKYLWMVEAHAQGND